MVLLSGLQDLLVKPIMDFLNQRCVLQHVSIFRIASGHLTLQAIDFTGC